jgi:hypothetical protein
MQPDSSSLIAGASRLHGRAAPMQAAQPTINQQQQQQQQQQQHMPQLQQQ